MHTIPQSTFNGGIFTTYLKLHELSQVSLQATFFNDVYTTYLRMRGLSQVSPQTTFLLIVHAPLVFLCV